MTTIDQSTETLPNQRRGDIGVDRKWAVSREIGKYRLVEGMSLHDSKKLVYCSLMATLRSEAL